MASAGRNSAGFRPYLSLTTDEEAVITALLRDIEDGNDSDPDAVEPVASEIANISEIKRTRASSSSTKPMSGEY